MIRLAASTAVALILIWVFPGLVRSAETSGAGGSAPFSCRGRPAGYYADIESGCQRYHMCDSGGRRYSYECPNQTLFQQRVMICDHWFMVDCSLSESFFGANTLLGQPGKQFVSDNDQIFSRPQEESTLRRRPGGRRPVDRTSAAYLASIAQRPSTASLGAGTPAPNRVEPRTLPAAYTNNPFFRGLISGSAATPARGFTAPDAGFRPTPVTEVAFRPTPSTPTPSTTTPRELGEVIKAVQELRNRLANRRTEEAESSTVIPARATSTSDQNVVTRQGQAHQFAKSSKDELRDPIEPVAPTAREDAGLGADAVTVTELFDNNPTQPPKFFTVDSHTSSGNDAFTLSDTFPGAASAADHFSGNDAFPVADVSVGPDPLRDADVSTGVDAELELLTNTLELRLPDTRRMFFIADSPVHEAEMLRATNETVLTIALSRDQNHGPMRFKGARSPKGQRSDCPQCHPAFLQPGTCEPCVLIR